MKRVVAILAGLLFILPLFGQGYTPRDPKRMELMNSRAVNFGFKAGFNSSLFLISTFTINDVPIKEIQNNYKIGYQFTAFMRLNAKKHYLQPELCYQISRGEIAFDKLGSTHPDVEPDYASIYSDFQYIELPVLYGYNIIKRGPYGMGVFAGPKITYLWAKNSKVSFKNFQEKNIREELHPYNLGIVAGVGVNISRMFFDFRYEQGLCNTSKAVIYEDGDGTKMTDNIVLKRRSSILSFSLGIMF